MRVLVGFDGSEGAWDAVALAKRIERGGQGEIMLAAAAPPGERFGGIFQRPLQALAGTRVETRSLTDDDPARALRKLAEKEGVDLVVLGSPHRGAIGRALAGSVAESLLHHCSRPLAVAPRGYAASAGDRLGLIAVAYDGTPEAKRALRRGAALAVASGAKVRVLTVVAPAVPMPGGAGYAPIVGFDAKALIAEALAALEPGVEAEGRELAGAPAAALADACEDGVDLLVAGTRGFGTLGRIFAGSVCAKLIRIAPCPVLIAPPPSWRDRDEDAAPTQPRSAAAPEQEVGRW